jgi:hypothetical protein
MAAAPKVHTPEDSPPTNPSTAVDPVQRALIDLFVTAIVADILEEMAAEQATRDKTPETEMPD